VVGFDRAGLVAAVPDRATSTLDAIDEACVPPGDTFHQESEVVGRCSGVDDEVYVVRHQAEGIHLATQGVLPLRQRIQVEAEVRRLDEDGRAVVPALDDVMGMLGKDHTRRSRHG
jgi:hypothetical protein